MNPYITTMNENGRILIPALMRSAIQLVPGEEIIITCEDGKLQIRTRRSAMKEAQEFFMQHLPKDVSLVDELIKERRADAAKESK